MKNSKLFPILSYFYFILPILLFIVGWCNCWVATAGVIVIAISAYFLCKNAPSLWLPKNKKEILLLITCFVVAFIWVYWSGIGALVFQNFDHNCRNPVFELLVNQKWPVITSFPSDAQHHYMLTYYIAFWLLPAVVGKIFHSIQIGYYAQILWATTGVFLTFYYILSFLKNKTLWAIIIFIFFSGLDFIGSCITRDLFVASWISHLEWWFDTVQFSSFTTQLFWVFNQSLPAWLMTFVMLKEKNNKNLLFLYACLFIHSTLPAIGIFPIICYITYRNSGFMYKKLILSFNKLKKSFLNVFTFQNVIGGGLILLISVLYLTNNISGSSTGVTTSHFDIKNAILTLILFIPLEVGIFLCLIWKNYKHNFLYYLIWILFLIYPFLKVGGGFDFGMRATIPVLIVLYLFVVKVFDKPHSEKDTLRFCVLVAMLIIGSVTAIHEFCRTFYCTSLGYKKIESNLGVGNFFSYTDNNFFLKYAGKKLSEKEVTK